MRSRLAAPLAANLEEVAERTYREARVAALRADVAGACELFALDPTSDFEACRRSVEAEKERGVPVGAELAAYEPTKGGEAMSEQRWRTIFGSGRSRGLPETATSGQSGGHEGGALVVLGAGGRGGRSSGSAALSRGGGPHTSRRIWGHDES